MAVGALSANAMGDNKSLMNSIFDGSSDYHDNVDKYRYIFQSPGFPHKQNLNYQV